MNRLLQSGKYLFALSLGGIALTQFITLSLPAALVPLPAGMPGKAVLAIVTGIILIIAAVCIILNKMAKTASVAIGILFLIYLIYPHTPKLLSDIYGPNEWVVFLETLCFSYGGFLLASKLPDDSIILPKWNKAINKIAAVGKYLFAISIFIFGIQHIIYEQFILTLIPSWIPEQMLWSHLVKTAFLLTAMCLLLNIKSRLALSLLGIMFLSWLFVLHGPRVAASPKLEPEWISFFIAMAMSGICFMLASQQERRTALENVL